MRHNNNSFLGCLTTLAVCMIVFICIFGSYILLGIKTQTEDRPSTRDIVAKLNTKNMSKDIELWHANGPMQLPNDNSLPNEFVEQYKITIDQQDYFRRIVTTYREEITALAEPKSSTSLTNNKFLRIEIDPFETPGAKIEKEMREQLLKHFSINQLKHIILEINLIDPFYGFGQYSMTLEFGQAELSEETYTCTRSLTKGLATKTESYQINKIEDTFWEKLEEKRMTLHLSTPIDSILDDRF